MPTDRVLSIDDFAFTFPMWAFVNQGQALLLRTGQTSPRLPLFTDRDNAQTFAERSGMSPAMLLALGEPADVFEFLDMITEDVEVVLIDPPPSPTAHLIMFDRWALAHRLSELQNES
jgi:hypothetical protein